MEPPRWPQQRQGRPSAIEYSVSDYGTMIADRVRMSAFAKALELAIGPDSVVLDLGTGTGIFALLACRLGARRVFAVEPDGVIEVARETARANGYEDRIEFIQALSTRVTLPERATVLVGDVRGVLPLYRSIVPTITDARERLLTEDAVLIPCSDTLWAAPLESADVYDKRFERWDGAAYGLDLEPARKLTVNEWSKAEVEPGMLLAEPAVLATLDYRSISSPNVRADVSWKAKRDATMHGFAVWFDSELALGVSLSNAPGEPRLIYGQALFPLAEPGEVAEGDEISLRFSASLVGGEYVFAWTTRVLGDAGRGVKLESNQSTLFSFPLSSATLHRLGETAAPSPTPDGEAVSFVLARVDGRRTLGDLSQEVWGRFPELLRSPDEALRFVTEVTERYCRS
jgi:type I protein arginine methyltransferase